MTERNFRRKPLRAVRGVLTLCVRERVLSCRSNLIAENHPCASSIRRAVTAEEAYILEKLDLTHCRHVAVIMDGNGRWAQRRICPDGGTTRREPKRHGRRLKPARA